MKSFFKEEWCYMTIWVATQCIWIFNSCVGNKEGAILFNFIAAMVCCFWILRRVQSHNDWKEGFDKGCGTWGRDV